MESSRRVPVVALRVPLLIEKMTLLGTTWMLKCLKEIRTSGRVWPERKINTFCPHGTSCWLHSKPRRLFLQICLQRPSLLTVLSGKFLPRMTGVLWPRAVVVFPILLNYHRHYTVGSRSSALCSVLGAWDFWCSSKWQIWRPQLWPANGYNIRTWLAELDIAHIPLTDTTYHLQSVSWVSNSTYDSPSMGTDSIRFSVYQH